MKKLSSTLSEAHIQQQIRQYLSLRGIFHMRINRGSRGNIKFCDMPGCSDLIGILPPGKYDHCCTSLERDLIPGECRGRFFGIEVKTPTGKLSLAQESFRDAVRANGGLWILARSLDDVIKTLE